MTTQKRYIDRSELAQMLEVSVDVVRRNEKRWGIDVDRVDFNERLVRYFRVRALTRIRRFLSN